MSLEPPAPALSSLALAPREEVLRQQLNIRAYWAAKTGGRPGEEASGELAKGRELPAKWQLTEGIALRDWQQECIRRWFDTGGRGVVKVVTGAGKTVLALGLAERLQNEREPGLRVAVVVPTVVLLEQWRASLLTSSNLPACAIGCLGGGNQDAFDANVRILIAVLNSASAKLPAMGRKLAAPLLLIADECHRAGAEQMSKVFGTPRAYSLGLSATPERDDVPEPAEEGESDPGAAGPVAFDETLIGRELGPIIFELDYRAAIEREILARFVLRHYGLPLAPEERLRYERLSREITDLRKALQGKVKGRPLDGGALVGWARRASRGKSALAQQAAHYVRVTGQRKLLLYHAKARAAAVLRLVADAVADESRVILFHESIAEVMKLFGQLSEAGHQVVVEHSELSDSIRQESIRLFRDGSAQVLVSARSLIEGFDVPAADVGIVVASSSSVRQRVQTLGRILRRKPGHEDRTAILQVLYMAETTDEMIYEKEDWEQFTGAERNQYFIWDAGAEDTRPFRKDGPPRRPKPREGGIAWDSLHPGDDYPGAYEGEEFQADSQGNVRTSNGTLVCNPQGVPAIVADLRGSFGRFRITPQHQAILIPAGDGRLMFGGMLAEPFKPRPADAESSPAANRRDVELEIRTKADGPRFMLRIPGGELYAKRTETATDPARGRDAERLAAALTKLQRDRNVQVRKIILQPSLEVLTEIAGQRETVARLEAGLEFEDRDLP